MESREKRFPEWRDRLIEADRLDAMLSYACRREYYAAWCKGWVTPELFGVSWLAYQHLYAFMVWLRDVDAPRQGEWPRRREIIIVFDPPTRIEMQGTA